MLCLKLSLNITQLELKTGGEPYVAREKRCFLKVIPPIKPWIVKHAKKEKCKEIAFFTRGAWTVVPFLCIELTARLFGISQWLHPTLPKKFSGLLRALCSSGTLPQFWEARGNSRGKTCLLYQLPSPRVQVCFNRPLYISHLKKKGLFTKVEWKMWG